MDEQKLIKRLLDKESYGDLTVGDIKSLQQNQKDKPIESFITIVKQSRINDKSLQK